MLLLIEDLHWADRSTRAALAFLARSLQAERVLVVGTYRPDEMHRRHPLRPLLAELERDPRARRIALEPLTHDELADQLADILGEPPDGRAAGAAVDALRRQPAVLRGAARRRRRRPRRGAGHAARRADAARRAPVRARRRSCCGSSRSASGSTHPLLAEASGLDERALRDALREAVEGHILLAGDDGRYRFRHALLREVVDDDLLPGERAALHLRARARRSSRASTSAQARC